jgi:hypothetical protein
MQVSFLDSEKNPKSRAIKSKVHGQISLFFCPLENWRQVSDNQFGMWIRYVVLEIARQGTHCAEFYRARLSNSDGQKVLSDQKE